MVFFEAPHRLAEFLADAAAALGADRPAAVSRELTKTYEETVRGQLTELAAWAEAGVRGEVTVVIAGAPQRTVDLADAVAQVEQLVATGTPLKPASQQVAEQHGLSRKTLYDAALAARRA